MQDSETIDAGPVDPGPPDWAADLETAEASPTSPYVIQSAQVDQLYAALVKCFGALDNIVKGESATIPMKSGKSYSYDYADLGSILNASRKIVSDCGLGCVQPPTQSRADGVAHFGVATRIIHTSGQWMEFLPIEMPLEENPTAQAIGSALTYARRYGYNTAFQLATVDDDGAEAVRSNSRAGTSKGGPSGFDQDADETGWRELQPVKDALLARFAGDKGAAAAFWQDAHVAVTNGTHVAVTEVDRVDALVDEWIKANVHKAPATPPATPADPAPSTAHAPETGDVAPVHAPPLTMGEAHDLIGSHRMAELAMEVGQMPIEQIVDELDQRAYLTTGKPDECRARLLDAYVRETADGINDDTAAESPSESAEDVPATITAPDPAEAHTDAQAPESGSIEGIIAEVKAMGLADVRLKLQEVGLDYQGKSDQVRARLVQHRMGQAITA